MIQVDAARVYAGIPKRRQETHKGDYGRALLVCGSMHYTGAPFFAAQAAVNTGSGLVYLAVPRGIYPILAAKLAEPIFLPLAEDPFGGIERSALGEILDHAAKMDVCLIGPGLGRGDSAAYVVRSLIANLTCPMVLDADALFVVANAPECLRAAKGSLILTPHAGELVRLIGNKSPAAFAKEYGVTLVCKRHETVTICPDGTEYQNTTGNAGMAKGGSGDVLAGMITSLIGQGIAPEVAAYSGVWLHGRAGDLCKAELGEYGMTPSDLLRFIPRTLRDC